MTVVSTEITIIKKDDGVSPLAILKVTLSSPAVTISEQIAYPNCDDLDLAHGIAAVFVVGWTNELQIAMRQRPAKIKLVTLSATAFETLAEVDLEVDFNGYDARTTSGKTYNLKVKLTAAVTKVAQAETEAIQALRDLLSAAEKECEQEARDWLDRVASLKIKPRWLSRAKEALS